jgi:hypothetical protein
VRSPRRRGGPTARGGHPSADPLERAESGDRGARARGRGARRPEGPARATGGCPAARRLRGRSPGRLPAPGQLAAARARVSDVRAALTGVALDSENLRTSWVRDAQDARTKRRASSTSTRSSRSSGSASSPPARRAIAPRAPAPSAPNTGRSWVCSTGRWKMWSPMATSTSSASSSCSSSPGSWTRRTTAGSRSSRSCPKPPPRRDGSRRWRRRARSCNRSGSGWPGGSPSSSAR